MSFLNIGAEHSIFTLKVIRPIQTLMYCNSTLLSHRTPMCSILVHYVVFHLWINLLTHTHCNSSVISWSSPFYETWMISRLLYKHTLLVQSYYLFYETWMISRLPCSELWLPLDEMLLLDWCVSCACLMDTRDLCDLVLTISSATGWP